MAIDYGILQLFQSMVSVIMFAHWAACVWMVQVSFMDDLADSWVYGTGYCIDTPADPIPESLQRWNRSPPIGERTEYLCLAPATIYAAALYWAVMTITSIGYGAPPTIADRPHRGLTS